MTTSKAKTRMKRCALKADAAKERHQSLVEWMKSRSCASSGEHCFVYPNDGTRITVHRSVLLCSPLLRSALASAAESALRDSGPAHLFLPDLIADDVIAVLAFLHNGHLSGPHSKRAHLTNLLSTVLGFTDKMRLTAMKPGTGEVDEFECPLSNCPARGGGRTPYYEKEDLFPHLVTDLDAFLARDKGAMEKMKPVECGICKYYVNYSYNDTPTESRGYETMAEHYRNHHRRLKILTHSVTGLELSVDGDASDDDDHRKPPLSRLQTQSNTAQKTVGDEEQTGKSSNAAKASPSKIGPRSVTKPTSSKTAKEPTLPPPPPPQSVKVKRPSSETPTSKQRKESKSLAGQKDVPTKPSGSRSASTSDSSKVPPLKLKFKHTQSSKSDIPSPGGSKSVPSQPDSAKVSEGKGEKRPKHAIPPEKKLNTPAGQAKERKRDSDKHKSSATKSSNSKISKTPASKSASGSTTPKPSSSGASHSKGEKSKPSAPGASKSSRKNVPAILKNDAANLRSIFASSTGHSGSTVVIPSSSSSSSKQKRGQKRKAEEELRLRASSSSEDDDKVASAIDARKKAEQRQQSSQKTSSAKMRKCNTCARMVSVANFEEHVKSHATKISKKPPSQPMPVSSRPPPPPNASRLPVNGGIDEARQVEENVSSDTQSEDEN